MNEADEEDRPKVLSYTADASPSKNETSKLIAIVNT